jgi:hypothetical protein
MFGKRENYLEISFQRNNALDWECGADGIVELHIEHKGFYNKIAQTVFKRPRISHIKMDEMGSFIWLALEKEDTILKIASYVNEMFGEKAEPLLPRLVQFFKIMENNSIIVRS